MSCLQIVPNHNVSPTSEDLTPHSIIRSHIIISCMQPEGYRYILDADAFFFFFCFFLHCKYKVLQVQSLDLNYKFYKCTLQIWTTSSTSAVHRFELKVLQVPSNDLWIWTTKTEPHLTSFTSMDTIMKTTGFVSTHPTEHRVSIKLWKIQCKANLFNKLGIWIQCVLSRKDEWGGGEGGGGGGVQTIIVPGY